MATGRIATIGLFVAALFVQPVLAMGEGTNLLENGGFEEQLSGWNAAEGHSLVGEATAAHSGKRCLTGAVTQENQALFLCQRVSVKAGNRYLFEIWARATNRTKLVLRTVPPGAQPPGGPVEVKITARCPAETDRIEVCRNNRFIYTKSPPGKEATVTFIDREPVEGQSYYYVRLIQKDEEIAWSSPVWFGTR